jgi:TolA-binding protein
MKPHRLTPTLLALSLLAPAGGCIALKADQDDIAKEVDKLRKEVLAQSQAATHNDELADELEAKLAEVEDLLRRNQADLGLRVDNLESDVNGLRGEAENADFQASAARQELLETRGDIDQRLGALEEKLNEATNIPESKSELLAEAEAQFGKRKYKQARKLWRVYESRYPGDAKMPEVSFKIGLTYFSERDYKSALGEFYRVIQEQAESDAIPDALYYSGLSFAKLGQCQNAIAYFDALKTRKKAPKEYRDRATEQIAEIDKHKEELCVDKDEMAAAKASSGKKKK